MKSETSLPSPNSSLRPISIADLLLATAIVAFAIGNLLPGYRLAFYTDGWLPKMPRGRNRYQGQEL